ncbi:MAG: AgmX/PglI C-terminal domain-containing protein, partial [Myxococcaceae bacterium]
ATSAPAKAAATTPGQQAAGTRPAKPERPARRTVASASTSRPVEDRSDPDGLSMKPQFDQDAINAVVASKQKSLFPCFVDEAKRSPGLAARIPLEFVVGNDGRVSKLWVDHPQFKTGPLHECLFGELRKWSFKAYEGELATVSISFNIGKKR